MRIKMKSIIAVMSILCIIISGCSRSDDSHVDDSDKLLPQSEQSTDSPANEQTTRFNEFCEEMFLDIATQDAMSINYFISNPSNYNITEYPDIMIYFDSEDYKVDLDEVSNYRKGLDEFDYDTLSYSQQITYDTIQYYLDCCLEFCGLELLYEPLGPTIGFQAELPVTLAEYSFYTADDIERYLNALPSVYDSFKEIMEFETLKSKEGYFMSDKCVEGIVEQCSDFIKNRDDNFLITSFDTKIDNYDGLTDEQCADFKKRNKDIVLEKIIPAYELMINELNSLKGTGVNDGGLCNLPSGKSYYNYLISSSVGDNISAMKIKTILQERIDDDSDLLYNYAAANMDYFNKLSNADMPQMEPGDILKELYNMSKEDFPEIDTIHYTLKTVDKSLEDYLSPAMYYKPPVDSDRINSIYINNAKIDDNIEIFTTLAHEGYPGHMYQFNYEKKNDNQALRQALGFSGVSEGWAEYVEYKSYDYIEQIDGDTARGLALNSEISLCVQAVTDIGVNYEGWSVDDVYDYVSRYFTINQDVAENVYQSCIETPANTLCYAYGSIVYEELREAAEQKKGDSFDEKEFHKFILDVGFSTLSILKDRFDKNY